MAASLEIVCVFFDGVASRQEPDEYVEIRNAGGSALSLEGWTLLDSSDGGPSFVFPSHVLDPGKSIRVYTNEDHPEWGGFSFARGSAIWNNSDPDTATLLNPGGEAASSRSYGTQEEPGCQPVGPQMPAAR